MLRTPWLSILALSSLSVLSPTAAAAQTLVLPLRTIGVSDTTATVVGDLLAGELESRGIAILPASRQADHPRGDAACDDAACAADAAANHGASQVVYGSLSRLGDKIILRIRALRTGETTPSYMDQLTSTTEEDLDAVVRRAADGLASSSQAETTLTTDLGVGLMALRTYDLSIIVDLRYHIVWADFDAVGGKGAHGISLTFGTSR